jgi:hypothetical protein
VDAKAEQVLPASTSWYAPGVGLVKWESSFRGDKQTQVLKSFTPAK